MDGRLQVFTGTAHPRLAGDIMAELEARLRFVIPLTLVLVVALLYLSMRGWAQTWLVLLSLPFAIAGSVETRPSGSG